MNQWTWKGGTADWYTGADWTAATLTTATFPQAGDTATIATGLATIVDQDNGGTLNNLTLDLSAGLAAQDEIFGPGMLIQNNVLGGTVATLAFTGLAMFEGVVAADAPQGAGFRITDPGELTNTGRILAESQGGTIAITVGTFINSGLIISSVGDLTAISATRSVINTGTLVANGAILDVTGSLSGYGYIDIELGGTATLAATSAGQSIDFSGSAGTLVIPATGFSGLIEGFGSGGLTVIDIIGISATGYSYNTVDGLLSLLGSGGAVVDTLEMAGELTAASFHIGSDGHGGELVTGPLVRTLSSAGGDWYSTASWTTGAGPYANSAPLAGDTAFIAAGTATISAADVAAHGSLDHVWITLGTENGPGAELLAAGETFGTGVTLIATGAGTLALTGPSTFAGYLEDGPGGDLYLGDTGLLTNTGAIFAAAAATIAAPTIVNDGTLGVGTDGSVAISKGVVLGAGNIQIGGAEDQDGGKGGGTLTIAGGVTVAATQRLDFMNGLTNDLVLTLQHATDFAAAIDGFVRGDTIVLQGMMATSKSYNASTGELTLFAGGASPAAVLDLGLGYQTGNVTFAAVNGATTLTTTVATSDGSDVAVGGPTARADDDVSGANITIGIISDSFNSLGGAAADQASGDLPTGSALADLRDVSNGTDEGRAMAELIHKIAPGATIDFYSGNAQPAQTIDGSIVPGISAINEFALGVGSLVAAGANIIVDDLGYPSAEPFFEQGDTASVAIEAAIAKGVSFFSAIGNNGNDYYNGTYTALATTLPGISGVVEADDFGGGNPFQPIYIAADGSISLNLQWNQPFASIGTGVSAANNLSMYLYDQNDTLVASNTIDDVGGNPEKILSYVNTGTVGEEYRLALVWDQGSVAPGEFLYVNGGEDSVIDSPTAGTGPGDVAGHDEAPGANIVGAVNYIDTPAFGSTIPVLETFSDSGPGLELFNGNGQSLATPVSDGEPSFVAEDGASTSPAEFSPFPGTSAAAPDAAAVAALMMQVNPSLKTNPSLVTSILEESALSLGLPASEQGAGLIQAITAVQLADALGAACYLAGTRIATARGATAIERLRVGQRVRTMSGALRPIRWIGQRRLDCSRHPQPERVRPIRVSRDAVAPGVPCRDLLLSPDHALFIDGVLMPVRVLLNGTSIRREAVDVVEYFHVELDSHDILLAEGLPAESYLDTGNRAAFDNGAAFLTLHPDFAPRHWDEACAELVQDGPRAVAAKQRLFARAGRAEAAPRRSLAIFAGHQALTPTILPDGTWLLALPPRVRALHLVSPATVAAEWHAASLDQRELGVRVFGIEVDGARLALDAPNLFSGFHLTEQTAEGPCRWTDGDARLVLPPGARMVALRIGDAARWADAA